MMSDNGTCRWTRFRNVLCLTVAIVLLSTPTTVVGQIITGSVVGIVADSSGAAIPDAKLVLTDISTGVQRSAASDATGNYAFPDVRPGRYIVKVTVDGFKQLASSEIVVAPAQSTRFDAQMQVGTVSETIEVQAQAPTLNTENAQLGDILTRDELVNLPLASRFSTNFRYITSSNYDGGYIAGQRSSFGYYSVDGVSAMAPAWGAWGGPIMGMSMEALQDISFVTATPTAEYGDLATISLNTRSGTNNLHFSGFWDHSNYAFNAAGYFSHSKGKGPQLHEVGGSVGGPVYIPKVYDGRNRTFFFFNWEDRIAPGGYWSIASVPTPKMRSGDFSEVAALGVTIYDPTNGQPFLGNVIPSSRISQISQRIQSEKYFPLPNFGGAGAISENYREFYSTRATSYFPTVRGDHNFRDGRDTISMRLNYRHDPEPGNLNGLPFFNREQFRNATNTYISETHLFGPSVVNQIRWGFTRDFSIYNGTPLGAEVVSDWGLNVPNMDAKQGLHGVPRVGISDFATLWAYTDTGWDQRTNDISDTVTFTLGKHVVKAGFTYRHYLVDEDAGSNDDIFGALDFRAFGTQNANEEGGYGYASFLLGIPFSSGTHDRSPKVMARYRTLAAFLQEDWTVTPRLTVNLGLRFETTSTPVDVHDMRFAFDANTGSLVVPNQKVIDTLVSPVFPKNIPIVTASAAGFQNERSLLKADNTWGPRVGFAYRLGSQFVIRGGGGLYYTPLLTWAVIDPYAGGPFQLNQHFQNQLRDGAPLFNLSNPFSLVGSGDFPGVSISSGVNKIRTPYTEQWNLTLERQLGASTVARASYRGHHTTQLFYYPDLNQPRASNNPDNQWNLVYPNFWNVYQFRNGGSEIGHLFEFELQRKFSKGLTFQAGYTHAKVVTNARGSDFLAWPEYAWDLKRDAGNENGVSRHRFTSSGVWEIPFGKSKQFGSSLPGWMQQAIGNWQSSYILTLQSGQFLDPWCGDCPDTAYARVWGGRPDLVGDPKIDNATTKRWFNSAAFRQPALGSLGNSAPGVIVGPGLVNFNYGLFKNINVGEKARLQLRMTSTNIFNHPNFGNPNTNISSLNAGRITGTTGRGNGAGPRVIKLGLRFDF